MARTKNTIDSQMFGISANGTPQLDTQTETEFYFGAEETRRRAFDVRVGPSTASLRVRGAFGPDSTGVLTFSAP